MKPLTKDIVITISIKLLLLVALWWVCVKSMRPVLESSQNWLLGHHEQSVNSNKK